MTARPPNGAQIEGMAWVAKNADRLRAAGDWFVERERIRCRILRPDGAGADFVVACPVTAMLEPPTMAYIMEGRTAQRVGLSQSALDRIVAAADDDDARNPCRRAILQAVGLDD